VSLDRADAIIEGGRHVARIAGTTNYSHSDWLGTERLRTQNVNPNAGPWVACESVASLPFGDGQVTTPLYGTGCYHDSTLHFTGKERDSESGLDNFGARYNSSSFGRWVSPDLPFADQNSEDPQSWNLYGYVRNNPLNNIDTNGRVTWLIGGTWHNPSDWDASSDLGQDMAAGFFDPDDHDVVQIPWSGGNSASARAQLAANIVAAMKAHPWKPGEQNNIVCHSHGCNGVMAALPTLLVDGFFVNNLVSLGQPMRGDYRFTRGSVGAWWNIYSPHDLTQRLGGRIPFFGGRTNPSATNIRANPGKSPFGNHSALHNDYLTRLMWELAIRDAESQLSQQQGKNPSPPIPPIRFWPFL
jgi:RHS repeat-associated protein